MGDQCVQTEYLQSFIISENDQKTDPGTLISHGDTEPPRNLGWLRITRSPPRKPPWLRVSVWTDGSRGRFSHPQRFSGNSETFTYRFVFKYSFAAAWIDCAVSFRYHVGRSNSTFSSSASPYSYFVAICDST